MVKVLESCIVKNDIPPCELRGFKGDEFKYSSSQRLLLCRMISCTNWLVHYQSWPIPRDIESFSPTLNWPWVVGSSCLGNATLWSLGSSSHLALRPYKAYLCLGLFVMVQMGKKKKVAFIISLCNFLFEDNSGVIWSPICELNVSTAALSSSLICLDKNKPFLAPIVGTDIAWP